MLPTRAPVAVARRVLAASVLAAGCAVAAGWALHRRRAVTFVDVAPVIYRRCAPCHRPGEAAPFPLVEYADVRRRARQIRRVTADGYMPPWKPVPGYARYLDDRSLTRGERALLDRWVAAGAPRGDPAAVPPPPRWPAGWQLGQPDVVLRLPEAYELPADGPDIYRNFVFPAPVGGAHYVAAWEFRAEGRAIHHAILNIDRHGWARQRDAADPGPGFAGMDVGHVQSPDGFYLVWTPGKAPSPPRPGASWRLDDGTDLVLQLHLHPTGRPETVQPTLGLYFTTSPPTVPRLTLRLGDGPIDIPAGDARWTLRDEVTLPTDVVVLALFPHAHYLGRRLRSWAALPDGRVEWLLRIDDWDPAWQEEYTFARPVLLPRGSVLRMEFTYDNSAANERNPFSPPRRVVGGEQSTDEMGNITYQVMPRDPRDLAALQEFKYRRQAAGDPRAEYNLANALARQGRTDEAIEHLRHVIALAPDLDVAYTNLGNLLLARGDHAGAIEMYRAALRVRPGEPVASANLAIALDRGR